MDRHFNLIIVFQILKKSVVGPCKLILFFYVMLFASCRMQDSFVPTGFDPVLPMGKRQVMLSTSLRPLTELRGGATYCLSSHLMARAGYQGLLGRNSWNFAGIYQGKILKKHFFIAGIYGQQRNVQHKMPLVIFGKGFSYREFDINAEFNSPAIAAGITFQLPRAFHQVSLKVAKNFVKKYSVYYWNGNAEEYELRLISDNERLDHKIPDFYSTELSYNFIYSYSSISKIQFQLTKVFCQKSAEHTYSFVGSTSSEKENIVTKTKLHPVSRGFYIAVGLCFIFPKK